MWFSLGLVIAGIVVAVIGWMMRIVGDDILNQDRRSGYGTGNCAVLECYMSALELWAVAIGLLIWAIVHYCRL